MSYITLITQAQNPKGRRLIQDGANLHVFSECCDSPISRTGDLFSYVDMCDNCAKELGNNYEGWSSFIMGISNATGSVGGSRWEDWAVHWFGLHDFGIKVEES